MPSCRICGLTVGVCAHTKHRIQIPDLYEKIAILEERQTRFSELMDLQDEISEVHEAAMAKLNERLRAIEDRTDHIATEVKKSADMYVTRLQILDVAFDDSAKKLQAGLEKEFGDKFSDFDKRLEQIEFGIHKPFSDFTERLRAIETQLQQNTETYAEILGRIEELEKVTAWQESE